VRGSVSGMREFDGRCGPYRAFWRAAGGWWALKKSGMSRSVYLGYHHETNALVVLKEARRKWNSDSTACIGFKSSYGNDNKRERDCADLLRSVDAIRDMVPEYVHVDSTEEEFFDCMATRFAGGAIDVVSCRNPELRESVLAQIAQLCVHAHRHGVILYDVTLENFTLRPDGRVQVVDLGGVWLPHETAAEPLTRRPGRGAVQAQVRVQVQCKGRCSGGAGAMQVPAKRRSAP
jgi:hypothetical protein